MIKEIVTLAFNPETASPEIQEVFADDLARTLWLAIKPGHITTSSFSKNCLRYAKAIRKADSKGELDERRLFQILSDFFMAGMEGVIGPREQDFAAELLPYVKGEKNITFRIKNQ